MGRKPSADKQTKTEMLFFRATPDLRRKVEEAAAAKDRSISWLVEHYVKLGLNFEDQVKEAR